MENARGADIKALPDGEALVRALRSRTADSDPLPLRSSLQQLHGRRQSDLLARFGHSRRLHPSCLRHAAVLVFVGPKSVITKKSSGKSRENLFWNQPLGRPLL
jgi:hypothetical protein